MLWLLSRYSDCDAYGRDLHVPTVLSWLVACCSCQTPRRAEYPGSFTELLLQISGQELCLVFCFFLGGGQGVVGSRNLDAKFGEVLLSNAWVKITAVLPLCL